MYILNKAFAWLGIAIAALSTIFCPFVKAPLVGRWNLYQTDLSLFFITHGILAVTVIFLFMRKVSLFRWMTWIFAGWCVLGLTAVYFKINNYFGIRFFDGILAKTLHIQWGWFFLFVGAVVLLFSVRKK